MVRVIEAVETDDTRWVFLTILTLPCHISMFEHFSANTKGEVIIPDLGNDGIRVLTIEKKLFRALKVFLKILFINWLLTWLLLLLLN